MDKVLNNIWINAEIELPTMTTKTTTFLYNILENKNLKVEGCVMRICGNEEWRALNVSIDEDGSKSAVLKYENEENQLSR